MNIFHQLSNKKRTVLWNFKALPGLDWKKIDKSIYNLSQIRNKKTDF